MSQMAPRWSHFQTTSSTVILTAVKPRLLLVLTSDLPITCWSANLKRTGNWFLEIKTLWSLCRWSHVMIMLCPSLCRDPRTCWMHRYWRISQKLTLYDIAYIMTGRIIGIRGSCIPAWFSKSIDIAIFRRDQRSFLIYKRSKSAKYQ